MTTNTTPGREAERGLGLWHDPDAEYLYGLGRTGSIVAIIGLFVIFVAFIPPQDKLPRVTVVTAVVACVVGPFMARDRWDRSLYNRLFDEAKWLLHRYSGRALYSAPWWLSTDHVEATQLPGLLNQVSVTQLPFHLDTDLDGTEAGDVDAGEDQDDDRSGVEPEPGEAFAVVHHPKANTASIVLECRPDGAGLADADDIAARTTAWDRWLAAMADEPDLAGIQVVSEAAPTLRTPARDHLRDLIATDGADAGRKQAAELLAGVVKECTGRVGVRTWVTISWAPSSGRARNRFGGPELAARVERLAGSLSESGAGTVTALDRRNLATVWAGMYNPARREHLATADEISIGVGGAGPVTHLERRARYCVDNFDAISLTMGIAPDTAVTPAVHERLAAGIEGTRAVRWALLFRPVDAIEARTWSKSMRHAIETRLAFTGDRRPSATDLVADEDATATATALARGRTALTRVAFAITLTLPADADPAGPIERTRAAAAPLSPHLRVMNGAHQTIWVATLPGALPVPLAKGLAQ
ncbi:MAG: SCO6880 family protein [Actinomycetota bacterium]